MVHNGEVRGTLSSVAVTDDGTVVALSLLHRSIEDGEPIDLRWAGGSAVAIVRDLPMQEPLLPVPESSPVGPSGQGSG